VGIRSFPHTPCVNYLNASVVIITARKNETRYFKEGESMGLFDKVFGDKSEEVEVPDLEEVMEAEGDMINPPADFYVKRVDLRNEGDGDLALKELAAKNVIILNVLPLSKQPNRLKGIISKLKSNSAKVNGDIALLSTDMILLTPKNVKIVKSKPKPKAGRTVIE